MLVTGTRSRGPRMDWPSVQNIEQVWSARISLPSTKERWELRRLLRRKSVRWLNSRLVDIYAKAAISSVTTFDFGFLLAELLQPVPLVLLVFYISHPPKQLTVALQISPVASWKYHSGHVFREYFLSFSCWKNFGLDFIQCLVSFHVCNNHVTRNLNVSSLRKKVDSVTDCRTCEKWTHRKYTGRLKERCTLNAQNEWLEWFCPESKELMTKAYLAALVVLAKSSSIILSGLQKSQWIWRIRRDVACPMQTSRGH